MIFIAMKSFDQLLEYLLNEQDDVYSKDAHSLDYVLNEPPRKKIPHGKMNLFKNEGYHNLLSVLKKATKEEIDYWSNWYQYANGHVRQLADKYDLPLPVAAAVTAVLSPNLGWKTNLMAADRTMKAWEDNIREPEGVPAYKTNVRKAMKILDTGDVGFVKGPKVSVFFDSLLNPDKVERELVLDGHAINAWRGIKTSLKNIKGLTKNERAAIIHDYRKVADLVGLTPQQLQSVVWYIWKSVKNPPKVSGKFKVEQPAVREAKRRRLTAMIQEMAADILSL